MPNKNPLFMLDVYVHICVGACRGQKRALDLLELEPQAVVSCPV